jgi:hypothetical protein
MVWLWWLYWYASLMRRPFIFLLRPSSPPPPPSSSLLLLLPPPFSSSSSSSFALAKKVRTFLVGFETAVERLLDDFSDESLEDLVRDEPAARKRERKQLEQDISSLDSVLAAFNNNDDDDKHSKTV